jgi:1,2-diacylglycerol 3-beta-glucosyltransferase
MMSIVLAVQLVKFGMIGFFVVYLGMLTVLALTQKERRSFPSRLNRRFAFVVPAHNEAVVIKTTIKSLFSVAYPRDRFDVVVVADNCDDPTAAMAKELGAIVHERHDLKLRGKGYALRWCFDRLLTGKNVYDAIVVVDADSVVSENFLEVMNHYLDSGSKVIQGSDLADSGSQGWSAEMIRLSFLLYNFVRPLGRSALGCSAGLKGNGMCFDVEVLSTVPWSSFSLNEDLEYGLELLLRGYSVRFAPEAKVLAKMPQDAENAQSQRVRWETGRFPVIRKYSLKLIAAAFRNFSFSLFDAFVELVTPSLVNMFLIASGMFALNLAMAILDFDYAMTFTFLWLVVLGIGFVHVSLGSVVAKAEKSTLLSLLQFPRYVVWKLKLYFGWGRSGRRTGQWVRTTREAHPRDSQLRRPRNKEE